MVGGLSLIKKEKKGPKQFSLKSRIIANKSTE